jgi:hypothetical protein
MTRSVSSCDSAYPNPSPRLFRASSSFIRAISLDVSGSTSTGANESSAGATDRSRLRSTATKGTAARRTRKPATVAAKVQRLRLVIEVASRITDDPGDRGRPSRVEL